MKESYLREQYGKVSSLSDVRAMVQVLVGCRIEQLTALEWMHIDFENGAIRTEQSAQRLKDKRIIIKEPKVKGRNTERSDSGA